MTGDADDIFARLKSYLPPWFGAAPTPVLDSLLGGIAWALAGLYGFYLYAKAQTRIRTATGFWLDLIAYDFFRTSIRRKAGQTDASFRAYIVANLLRPRATRPSMEKLLLDLTGQAPIIFEPSRPFDTGAFRAPGSRGFFRQGRYGSLAVPYTCFITAYRPLAEGGLAGAGFFRAAGTGLRSPTGRSYLGSLTLASITVDDADIYAAIDANKVAGTICWVGLTAGVSVPVSGSGGELDFSDPDNSGLLGAL